MQLTIHPTSKIVELQTESGIVPARIWEGLSALGVPVLVYVTRVQVLESSDLAEFESELLEQQPPSPAAAAIPLRLIL